MDPNPQDMEWMTDRAYELVKGGMEHDAAITQALEEGEARARRRRAEDWQKERAVEDSLRTLDKQRQQRDQGDGSVPTLRVSFGDLIKKRT